MQNSASKFKTHPKSAEIVKNKAWLENYPKIFNSDPTHIVDPVRRNRSQVPVHPLNTLDFSIISLEKKKSDKMAGKNSDKNIHIPPALLVRFA